MVCFEDRLATEWYRIYQAMETVVDGHIGTSLLVKGFPQVDGHGFHENVAAEQDPNEDGRKNSATTASRRAGSEELEERSDRGGDRFVLPLREPVCRL